MDVILVRHGHDVRASPSRPLSATGLAQAEAAGRWLADQGVTELWSGTLDRARGTANVIAGLVGLAPREDVRLDEIANNALDTVNLPPPRERSWWQGHPGAEDWLDFRIRVAAFISDLCRTPDPERRAVLVTHSGVFDAVHEIVCGGDRRVELDVTHTGMTWWRYRYGSRAGAWLLRAHNMAGHLDGMTHGADR